MTCARDALGSRLRRERLHDERGAALVVVLAVTGILSLLVAVSVSIAQESIQVRDRDPNDNAALSAAQAGLDDYLFLLNNEDDYWIYDDDNLPPDHAAVPAFTEFVSIAGGETNVSVDEGIGMFTYDVDNISFTGADGRPPTGVIRVSVTGCAPGPCDIAAIDDPTLRAPNQAIRTITAELSQDSFLDFLYFTNYETLAPIVYSTEADRTWAASNCNRRRWQQERPSSGRPSSRGDGCLEIFWGGNDVVDGPFHTNDRFRLNGNATWRGTSSNSDPRVPAYDTTNGARPNFAGGALRYRAPLEMPPTNTVVKLEADHLVNPSAEGCLFTGPTEIILRADGRLQVQSPHTRSSGSGCGSWPSNGTQLINIPRNGVVFVQEVPDDPSDPNYSSSCNRNNGDTQRRGNGIGYPRTNDDGPQSSYPCFDGDAFVEGTLDGRLTIAAANDVTITWHIDYENRNEDMLGLIAQDFVQVYHPVQGNSNLNALPNHDSRFTNPRIDAALLSVSNSFLVQNWGSGSAQGNLNVYGAIAQIYRGPVGTGSGVGGVSTGYDKRYVYDQRLQFTNPPNFIDPVAASWRVSRYAEDLS